MFFGGFGGQQIIINNGYGTTTIIQNDGWFGRKEQIIINNGYGGYGGTTTIIQNGGLFGGRQEIIISCPSNCTKSCCYGRNRVVCQPGCTLSCCYGRNRVVCQPGCTLSCCYGRNKVVCQPGCTLSCCYGRNKVVCQPGCTLSCCYGKNRALCLPGCMKSCCYVKPRNNYVTCAPGCNQPCCYKVVTCPPGCQKSCCFKVVLCPPGCMKSCCYGASNLCPPGCQRSCCSNLDMILICPPGCKKTCCKVVICQRLLQLRNGVWTGPRAHPLTLKKFDLHLFPSIHKLKVRTTIQPYSLQLSNRQIIMKAHVGFQTHFFAAQYLTLQTYFLNIVYLKLNSVFPESTERFKGELSGIILKKSQFLGNWQQRYVRITRNDGLRSHKSVNSASSLHISSIRQLWTRFEILRGKYFVIKLSYIGVKFQFAVPVNQCLPWTQAFFSMLERR